METGTGNTILLNDIPSKYFAKEFLVSFYSQFGVIIKIDMKPFPSKQAFITFVDYQSAKLALQNGTILNHGEHPIQIVMIEKQSFKPSKEKTSVMKPAVVVAGRRPVNLNFLFYSFIIKTKHLINLHPISICFKKATNLENIY